MNIEDVRVGQVFKDNDQPNRIVYPYITVTGIERAAGKAVVSRSKDIDGKVRPRDVRTLISLKRLIKGGKYGLVKSPAALPPLNPDNGHGAGDGHPGEDFPAAIPKTDEIVSPA
jgi:hypothetical protein